MIDAFNDKLLTMTEAAKQCPKVRGKRPSNVTLWRWATKGQRGVKLEHVRVGRNMLTTEAAMTAFFRALANAPAVEREPLPKGPIQQTEKQRDREIAKAKARLIARGMLPKETEH